MHERNLKRRDLGLHRRIILKQILEIGFECVD
jgi:hypothetical protein